MFKYFIIFFLTVSICGASEIDNFTQRYQNIEDSLPLINKEINSRINLAVMRANRKTSFCNEKKLFVELKHQFVFFGYSKFEIWMHLNKAIPKKPTLKEHIYHNAGLLSSGSAVNLPFAMSPLFNVGGHLIGADKFSHLFTEGWIYFQKIKARGKSLEQVLSDGLDKEVGLWGGLTMGIISYGDLTANFLGLQFWQSILDQSDFLNAGPYISCQNNKWVQLEDLNMTTFLHDALDEGINCSQFTKPKLEQIFLSNIRKLENKENKNFSCPISYDKCQSLSADFPSVAQWFINPVCL